MQGRNRVADIENGCVDTVGEGAGGTKKRIALTYIYMTMCKIDSYWESALQHRELSSILCDDLVGWDGGGRQAQERGDICIVMADSHHCYSKN